MSEVYILLDQSDTTWLLKLAGVFPTEAKSWRKIEQIQQELVLNSKNSKIILFDNNLTAKMSPQFLQSLLRKDMLPIFLPCPPLNNEEWEIDQYITGFIKTCTNYNIRLNGK